MPETRQSEYLRPREIAQRLNVSPKTVSRMAQRGELPCVRISERIVRFDWASVLQALTGSPTSSPAA